MRIRGFALSELLVAVAIAGLIVGVLTFLNVDYVGLARRVVDIQSPYALGGRAETSADLDRCAHAGATLTATNDAVVAEDKTSSTSVLTLATDGAATQVLTAGGGGGRTDRPVRVIVENAPAPGGSVASIEVGDATVGVIAPRCDLTELCDYDATNAVCLTPDTNAVDAGDAMNAANGGNALAGHG
jgi:CBS domain-containing protein